MLLTRVSKLSDGKSCKIEIVQLEVIKLTGGELMRQNHLVWNISPPLYSMLNLNVGLLMFPVFWDHRKHLGGGGERQQGFIRCFQSFVLFKVHKYKTSFYFIINLMKTLTIIFFYIALH